MKYYITKYALTKGIFEVESIELPEKYLHVRMNGYHQTFGLKDWHVTKEEAIARAKEMRAKKIANLEKQIKRLTSMEFDCDGEG